MLGVPHKDRVVYEEKVFIAESPGKGRGLFAAVDFPRNKKIIASPFKIIKVKDYSRISKTELGYYIFAYPYDKKGNYDEKSNYAAIVFGLNTFINHAEEADANAEWRWDPKLHVQYVLTTRKIKAGEEILWFYGWPEGSKHW